VSSLILVLDTKLPFLTRPQEDHEEEITTQNNSNEDHFSPTEQPDLNLAEWPFFPSMLPAIRCLVATVAKS
jgi:hypothetical protein